MAVAASRRDAPATGSKVGSLDLSRSQHVAPNVGHENFNGVLKDSCPHTSRRLDPVHRGRATFIQNVLNSEAASEMENVEFSVLSRPEELLEKILCRKPLSLTPLLRRLSSPLDATP